MPGPFGGRASCYRRNRYYDPQAAQFTQEDPIGIAGGLSLYGYAGGDPINFSDPFGLCPEPPCKGDFVSQTRAGQLTVAAGNGLFGFVFSATQTAAGESFYLGFGPVAGAAWSVTGGELTNVGEAPANTLAPSLDLVGGFGLLQANLSVTLGDRGEEVYTGVGLGTEAYTKMGLGAAGGVTLGLTWNKPERRRALDLLAHPDVTRVSLTGLTPTRRR
jgi:hypothetical protein